MTDDERASMIRGLEEAGLRDCIATVQGRAFLRWIFQRTGFRQNPFAQNALVMAHNTGLMQPGLDLERFIEQVDPAGLMRVLLEDYTDAERTFDVDGLDTYDTAH